MLNLHCGSSDGCLAVFQFGSAAAGDGIVSLANNGELSVFVHAEAGGVATATGTDLPNLANANFNLGSGVRQNVAAAANATAQLANAGTISFSGSATASGATGANAVCI